MRTKQERNHSISYGAIAFGFALLLTVAGCGGSEIPSEGKEDKVPLSDQEITIQIDGWKPLEESRAAIFETPDDFTNEAPEAKGGGNFTLHAYMRETGSTFIDGTRARYQASSGHWRFYSHPDYIEYYWPQSGSIDFFAYMPWKDSNRHKNITVGSYSKGTGLSISCQMQNEISNLEDLTGQETIIAYTTDKSKTKTDGSVNMHFVHPFAAVYFKLKQAHRDLTINWIRFDKVHLHGTTKLNATTVENTKITWTPSDTESTFIININKTIPTDINFNGEVGGPYLVMPQSFGKGTDATTDDVTITINYTWDDKDANTENTQSFTRSITTTDITSWIAGNKYTYILDLGDNKEEILFKVMVEPWTSHDYKNIVDVE